MSDGWRDSTDWQHLSAIVQRLKRKVEAAYYHGQEQEATEAHDDLCEAEWRMRQAQKREGGNG